VSEVRLVVREAECDWSGRIHGGSADRAIAALSADPVTLTELEAAIARFDKMAANGRPLVHLSPGLNDEPHDAGLVVIDLVARLVVVDSTYSAPQRSGFAWYHDGRRDSDTQVRYDLAEDWLFLSDGTQWRAVAEARRRELAARPPLDVREVFYGRPLLEYVAREVFAAFTRREAITAAVRQKWTESARARLARDANIAPDEVDPRLLTDEAITPKTWPGQEQYASPFYDTLKDIHAAWLLTPRDDLGGECPRSVALQGHEHIEYDLENRCQQWSRLGECPRGLDASASAYRSGGFGTHEWVKYYELVRALLWSSWDQLTELEQTQEGCQREQSRAAEDFVAAEVLRLEEVREAWLDTPDPELDRRTPRSIIDRERARLPEGHSGHEAMIDSDCPACQMMSEMAGPCFWHLDCSALDDDFAFDLYHDTREEWEQDYCQEV
jgi:hypothetical protein